MYKDLLDYAVRNKVYAEVAGQMVGGMDKTLRFDGEFYYLNFSGQRAVVFTHHMVKEIRFHKYGCTIILKG